MNVIQELDRRIEAASQASQQFQKLAFEASGAVAELRSFRDDFLKAMAPPQQVDQGTPPGSPGGAAATAGKGTRKQSTRRTK